MEMDHKMTQILDSAYKNFKAAVLSILKNVK